MLIIICIGNSQNYFLSVHPLKNIGAYHKLDKNLMQQ